MMSPQQIYSWHEPLAVALVVLTALFAMIETLRRRKDNKGSR
jgi:hypothetical protein